MAVLNARVSPFFNEIFTITSVWWEEPRNHRGLDITTGTNSNLHAIANGIVLFSGAQTDGQGNLTGYGYYIIYKDTTTNMGFLYAHMKEQSSKNVGDSVAFGEVIGIEGTTGDSTGIHLHFEMQDLTNHDWVYGAPKSYYTNPAEYMGIPNVEGTQAIYEYQPIPPIRNKFIRKPFPWVVMNKNLKIMRGENI